MPMESEASVPRNVATYSLVAYDAATDAWAIGVQSRFLGVGAVVPHARADGGAVATQAWANPRYGPDGLRLLREGWSAPDVVARLTADDDERDHRQLGVVDRLGQAAAYTGSACLAWAGHHVGESFTCQGNILAGPEVVTAMAAAFETATGELAQRVLHALFAAEAAGGDRRGRQSAALLIVRAGGGYAGLSDRAVDLRVDDHGDPLRELERLVALHRVYFRETEDSEDAIGVQEVGEPALLHALARVGRLVPGHATFDKAAYDAFASWLADVGRSGAIRDDGRLPVRDVRFLLETSRASTTERM